MPRLVYATRRSALALAQCRAFVARLKAAHPDLELVEEQVVTTGDKIQDRPLSEVGGKGLFVKEIEEALLERRADIAVHSIKDVPATLPDGLAITCIPQREDPRDVLVAPRYGTLADLPKGAKIGTSSLRRAANLLAVRPDLEIVPLRGNVDTRLRKVDAGEADGIILARAGLVRLGLADRATEVLSPEVSLPAVGQGALGIESRVDDEATGRLLAVLADEVTSRCVHAERGVLAALGADCKTPLGAYAERIEKDGAVMMRLRAFVANGTGALVHARQDQTVPWPASDDDATAFGLSVGGALLG
ncbi:MAG: hydroxymethylbilane synthase [Myxococcales bacterium 68-20]|nr:hydroxymethylbilane synthase [Myxococcales bacterium]OJY30854.1 MAG: hydroxymethylbilane synthase [Myxococcales bacterium 68-20]